MPPLSRRRGPRPADRASSRPLAAEDVPLAEAAGRVLARDVVATRAQPPFAASAMDGYAVRAADAAPGRPPRASSAPRPPARASPAGSAPARPSASSPARPVPEGADLVRDPGGRRPPTARRSLLRAGRDRETNIRPAGGDFAAGARIAAPRRLRPVDVALLAAMNVARVPVARRPVVALIATGDELVMPGEDPGPDQIVASNAFGLKAHARGRRRRGAAPADRPRHPREPRRRASRLAAGDDLIVTIGGASVGDFDLVARTALARGLELDFHRVAMRPGKPLMAGRLDGTPLVGLPGNPVSALVTGRLFLVAAVERMQGLPGDLPARARRPPRQPPSTRTARARTTCAPASTPAPDGWPARPFPRQDSSLLSVLSEANALLVRQPADPRCRRAPVEFIWL